MDLVPDSGRPAETLATIAQPLPAPGKRGAERALAAAGVAVAEAELAATERALLRDVRAAYAETWGLQQQRRFEGEAHELVDLLLETATALYGGGAERSTAPLEARVMLRRHELDQQETDAKLARGADEARRADRLARSAPPAPPSPAGRGALPRIRDRRRLRDGARSGRRRPPGRARRARARRSRASAAAPTGRSPPARVRSRARGPSWSSASASSCRSSGGSASRRSSPAPSTISRRRAPISRARASPRAPSSGA